MYSLKAGIKSGLWGIYKQHRLKMCLLLPAEFSFSYNISGVSPKHKQDINASSIGLSLYQAVVT